MRWRSRRDRFVRWSARRTPASPTCSRQSAPFSIRRRPRSRPQMWPKTATAKSRSTYASRTGARPSSKERRNETRSREARTRHRRSSCRPKSEPAPALPGSRAGKASRRDLRAGVRAADAFAGRNGARRSRGGRVLQVGGPCRSLAPDRGAGALSTPAGAAVSLPPPARVLARRESGDLLDALAGLPQRHAPGRARLRRAPCPHGDARSHLLSKTARRRPRCRLPPTRSASASSLSLSLRIDTWCISGAARCARSPMPPTRRTATTTGPSATAAITSPAKKMALRIIARFLSCSIPRSVRSVRRASSRPVAASNGCH